MFLNAIHLIGRSVGKKDATVLGNSRSLSVHMTHLFLSP